MQSSYDRQKKPFEIFTDTEIALASTIKNPELKDNFLKIITMMNKGIHSTQGGWYGKLTLAVGQDKKSELKSIDRYLEVSNKLQAPKNGETRTLVLRDKKFERPVNVYLSFWKECYRVAFHAQIVRISQLTKDQLANGLDKAYIYVLLQLKRDQLLEKWFDKNERQTFINEVKKVLQNIRAQTKLGHNYHLNEADQTRSIEIYKSFFQKTNHLIALQAWYETHDAHARYIHVRPAIVLQCLQVIDFFIKRYDAVYKKKPAFPFQKEKKDHVRDLLFKKKRELIQVIAFHQKLHETYQKDDLIEIIHDVVKNIGAGILPIQTIFETDKNLDIQLFHYDPEDLEAPKKIKHEDHSHFRKNYLWQSQYAGDLKPLEIIQAKTPETKHEVPGFIPLKKLFFVIEDTLISLKLPAALSEELITLCEKNPPELFSILDFFGTHENEREQFYKVNEYYKNFKFLFNQVNKNGLISFLSFNNSNQVSINQKCKEYLQQLLDAIDIFKKSYQNEINAIEISHPLINNYYYLLIATKKIFNNQIKAILFYWLDCLDKDLHKLAPLHETFKEFLDILGEAVRKMADKPLIAKYGDICEYIEIRYARRILTQ
jgi:hypothetical protein